MKDSLHGVITFWGCLIISKLSDTLFVEILFLSLSAFIMLIVIYQMIKELNLNKLKNIIRYFYLSSDKLETKIRQNEYKKAMDSYNKRIKDKTK